MWQPYKKISYFFREKYVYEIAISLDRNLEKIIITFFSVLTRNVGLRLTECDEYEDKDKQYVHLAEKEHTEQRSDVFKTLYRQWDRLFVCYAALC